MSSISPVLHRQAGISDDGSGQSNVNGFRYETNGYKYDSNYDTAYTTNGMIPKIPNNRPLQTNNSNGSINTNNTASINNNNNNNNQNLNSNIDKHKIASLLQPFFEDNMYPNSGDLEKIADEVNLTTKRVRSWFQAQRNRHRKEHGLVGSGKKLNEQNEPQQSVLFNNNFANNNVKKLSIDESSSSGLMTSDSGSMGPVNSVPSQAPPKSQPQVQRQITTKLEPMPSVEASIPLTPTNRTNVQQPPISGNVMTKIDNNPTNLVNNQLTNNVARSAINQQTIPTINTNQSTAKLNQNHHLETPPSKTKINGIIGDYFIENNENDHDKNIDKEDTSSLNYGEDVNYLCNTTPPFDLLNVNNNVGAKHLNLLNSKSPQYKQRLDRLRNESINNNKRAKSNDKNFTINPSIAGAERPLQNHSHIVNIFDFERASSKTRFKLEEPIRYDRLSIFEELFPKDNRRGIDFNRIDSYYEKQRKLKRNNSNFV